MHIRKLELQGFKSFPDRTTFHFASGISGVVGPNGCGKSNVVDAVKWCLGEQSARSLRGNAMQDVIFAGSEDRQPTGLAEVTITFSAGDEPFPGEYARYEELQVTRRLFRTGHSEYLVNQQKVRLRDVGDLFMDSGAANRLYSFIEQGRIGEIVSARPEQRRSLIEEAAGISRYKARCVEAQQRLDGTLENLDRLNDVLADQTSRLRALEKQVAKAMRYRRLRSHLRQGEIFLGLASYAGLAADRRVLAGQLRDAEADEARLVRDVLRREEELERGRKAAEVLEEAVGRTRDRLAELEASRRESESARQYQGREKAELERRVEELETQGSQARRDRDAAVERRARTVAERAEVEARLQAQGLELTALHEDQRRAEGAVRERRRRIEEGKARVLERVTALARLRAEIQAAIDRRAEATATLDRVHTRQSEAGTDLDRIRMDLDQARTSEGEALERRRASEESIRSARGAVEACKARADVQAASLRKTRETLSAAEREEARLRARLDSLEALQAAHAGVEGDVRSALGVPGVLGTLAENLDVPEALEAALACALGPALDSVLVPDAAVAVTVAARAKGHMGVVVLGDARPPSSGFAARFAGTDAGLRALARLLGDCAEAPDVAGALAAHEATGAACVVPDAPAFVSADGRLVLGVPGVAGVAILARRREIGRVQQALSEAREVLAAGTSEVEAAVHAYDTATEAWQSARGRQDAVQSEAGERELAHREAGRVRADLERELGRQEKLATQISVEETDMVRTIDRLTVRLAVATTEVDQHQQEQERVEEILKGEQSSLTAEHRDLDRAREALNQLAAESAGLRERLVGLRRSEAEVAAAEEAATRLAEGCARDRAVASARIDELIDDDQRLVLALQVLGEEQATLRQRLDEERERVRAEREGLARLEATLRQVRESREKATVHRADLDRRIVAVRDEIERIREQLEEKYELSAAGLLDRMDRVGSIVIEVDAAANRSDLPEDEVPAEREDPLLEDLRIVPRLLEDEDFVRQWVENVRKARNSLARLGEVNLVALQEYTEVAERHALLESQRADLDASVQSIRQTIARLNKISRERFRETFDRVNEWFQQLYPRLVGGGSARLVLTDEEDMLSTGVDIFVQPPGKRLQNLTLLSGGETAMVAIALIFSLFRVKPSPFCLLDEVDAPLDEGNGARFNSMLREMSELSQFIVITHNKKTMECADTLYGVTMPGAGVSRLVSVNLG